MCFNYKLYKPLILPMYILAQMGVDRCIINQFISPLGLLSEDEGGATANTGSAMNSDIDYDTDDGSSELFNDAILDVMCSYS